MRCAPMLLVQIHNIHFTEFFSNLSHIDVVPSSRNKTIDQHLSMCIYLAVIKVDMVLKDANACYMIASLPLLEL